MSATHVQTLGSAGNGTAGQTTTVLSPSSKTVSLGNTVVVGWFCYSDVTASGVQDNLGNTYSSVERRRRSGGTSALWSAVVTSAGSITTITVTHASTQYVAIVAAEFSSLAGSPTTTGGLDGTGSSTATWMASGTIPANGAAIGAVYSDGNAAHTAGAASGTPSTTIVLDAWFNGGAAISGSICYALAGAGDVTTFVGTTALASNMTWAGAGGIFSPVAASTSASAGVATATGQSLGG